MILYNKKIYDLHLADSILNSMRLQWTGHVAMMGRDRKYIQNFGGEISWKQCGRPVRLEVNNTADLTEMCCMVVTQM
jgi:hypothetical protein